MPNLLSTAEQFQDRIELVGYATLAASAAATIIYFAMLFFYQPVMLQSALVKIFLLLLGPCLAMISWWVTRHKNWARLMLSFFFLAFGLFSAVKTFHTHAWKYDLALGWSFFGYWVLSHPAAIAFFRNLSDAETRSQEKSGWFTLLGSFFVLEAWYLFYQGGVKLYEGGEPGQAMGLMGWSVLLLGLLFFAKRRKSFARWCLVLALAFAALAQVPETFTSHTYPAYWKALTHFSLLIGFSLFLAFSGFSRRFFQKDNLAVSPPA